MLAIKSQCTTLYKPLIVAFALSSTIWEILPVVYRMPSQLCKYVRTSAWILTPKLPIASSHSTHRRIYHRAIWAMPPPPFGLWKIFAYGKKCNIREVRFSGKIVNCCHQMSYFKAKMHQYISAGAPPQTPLRELTALPRNPSWISGVSFQTKGGKGKKGEGEGE